MTAYDEGFRRRRVRGQRTRWRVSLVFAWYDFWVGVFWDRRHRRVYLFPMPMFGVVIDLGGGR